MTETENERPVAALAVVTRGDGRVLLVRRAAQIPGGGYWVPPGGKPEAGETLAQAAVREVGEEVGLAVSVTTGAAVYRCPSSDGRWELHWFIAVLNNPSARLVIDPAEVDEAGWFGASDIADLAPMFAATRDFFARRPQLFVPTATPDGV